MASLVKVFLGFGVLVAVVSAAPQLSPVHSLGGFRSTSTDASVHDSSVKDSEESTEHDTEAPSEGTHGITTSTETHTFVHPQGSFSRHTRSNTFSHPSPSLGSGTSFLGSSFGSASDDSTSDDSTSDDAASDDTSFDSSPSHSSSFGSSSFGSSSFGSGSFGSSDDQDTQTTTETSFGLSNPHPSSQF